jgi:hypothetical protein
MKPIADTQSAAFATPPPSVTTNHAQGAGVTAATPPRLGKEPCNGCGCTDYQVAHFIAGRLLCEEKCWQGREPAVHMPPTPEGRAQLDLWTRPHRGVSP